MQNFQNIVILTGAGLSAESGLSTFRDKDGIWAKYDVEEVATPEGFARNPAYVYEFYNMRRKAHSDVKPNLAHEALAKLEQEIESNVLIVTQNIDNLHEQAGSQSLIHMHGEIAKIFCNHCNTRRIWEHDINIETRCPACQKPGGMRPDVVWFGEMPYEMDLIHHKLSGCDLFISIGTSGTVYPAAGFVALAHQAGAHTVELNLEPSHGASYFDETVHGPATQIVPEYVDKLLGNRA